MQEGEIKGFSDLPFEDVMKVGEICLKANKYEDELCKLLKEINDGKE